MYNEEHLPQDDVVMDMTAQDDDVSVSVSSGDDTVVIEKKLDVQFRKQLDPAYRKDKMIFEGQALKIESYSSDIHKLGGRIRHAVTGYRTPYECGTYEDNAFFSVMDVTNGPESRKLYYNTPEEFERHFKVEVPQNIKEEWLQRKIRTPLASQL